MDYDAMLVWYVLLGLLFSITVAPRFVAIVILDLFKLIIWPVSAVIWFADGFELFIHGRGKRRG